MLLIAAVLGSIYAGIATATEAAAVGVVGALVMSAVQGSLDWQTFKDSLLGGTRLYCMIALILAGAAFLTLSMGYIGLPRHLAEWIATLGLSQWQLLFALMLFYIVLGCFLDGISMVVLTMGVIMPTVVKAGIDPLWFGIFVVLVVEMAQITPPVGFNLFVLQGMTGREIGWIARVTLPFFFCMAPAVALITLFPAIVTCAAPGADGRGALTPRRAYGRRVTFDHCACASRGRRPGACYFTTAIARPHLRSVTFRRRRGWPDNAPGTHVHQDRHVDAVSHTDARRRPRMGMAAAAFRAQPHA